MLLLAPDPASCLVARSFGFHRRECSGHPKPRSGDRLPTRPRVAPVAASSSFAYGESPGRPGPSIRLRRLPADLRVSPAITPSSSTGRLIFGSPRISPSGGSADAYPGFPGSCIHGWVNDEPGQTRTLHPSAEPRDESSRPIGRRNLLQALCAFPTSLRPSACRTSPACETAQRNRNFTVLPDSYCVPIPYRFTNWKQSLG